MDRKRPISAQFDLRSMLAPVPTEGWRPHEKQVDAAERERIARLHELGILDTPENPVLQQFVRHAIAIIPGATIAAISLVDRDRQWFKAIIGLDVPQTSRSVSFCSHTIQTSGLLVVNDATKDARFAANELVTGPPNIRFYAGVRLARAAGALCVISPKPMKVSNSQLEKLVHLAQHVDIQLLAHGVLHNLDGQPRLAPAAA